MLKSPFAHFVRLTWASGQDNLVMEVPSPSRHDATIILLGREIGMFGSCNFVTNVFLAPSVCRNPQDVDCGVLSQMIMTDGALYLVVCDMSKFASPEGDSDDQQLQSDIHKLEELGICDWLRRLSWRVPGCSVILVGTKCDLLSGDEMKDIGRRMDHACRAWLEAWANVGRTVNIEPGISLTSCRGHGLASEVIALFLGGIWWSCDQGMGLYGVSTESLLNRITCGREEASIPRGWFIAKHFLDALDERR